MADRVISYEFRARYTNMQAGLTSLSKSTQDLGNKLTAADKQGQKMRAGLTQLGSSAGRVGLVAAGGLAAIVAATAKFESAMSRVSAATNASGDDLGKLRQAAIDLGADTIFSATEAADGITELGKAGLSTADILGGGLKGALDLAAAGQISVAEAAETTAITLSQYGLAGSEATRVSDALAAGAGKALGSVGDMAGALKYVGPVASQMGLSLEESAGAIAELASQGIIGEQAGTSLRGMLTSLTSPSKAAANQMEALGISMYDAQGQFVGIDGIAGQLQDTLGGLTAAQRDEALGRIFGNEQITAARVLYSGGAEAVQDWTDKVTDSGYAADQAAKLTDNLSGDLEQLKGSLESALIGSGEGSQGPLRSLTQGLTKVVDGFNSLPGAAKNGVTGLLAITAVTGGAAWFGAKVIGGIANTKQALEDLGISAGRTSTSLGRVARTGGGLIALAGAVSVLSSALGDAFGANLDTANLQRDLEGLAQGRSKDVLKRINEDMRILNETTGKVVEPFEELVTGFGAFSDTGLDKAANNVEAFDQALAGMVESGNAEQASAIFDQLLAAQTGGMVGASYSPEVIDKLMGSLGGYKTALENVGSTAGTTSDLTAGLSGETDNLAAAQAAGFQTGEEYAAAQKEAAQALKESRDAARDTATSIFGVGDSVNDAKVSLADWITDLEKQAQALKNFRKNAEEAADKGVRQGLIAALREQGPEGAMRLEQLADATETEIRRANRAWKFGQQQVAAYTDEVGGVPPANLEVNGTQAISVLTNVRGRVTDLGRMVARVLVQADAKEALRTLGSIQSYRFNDKVIRVRTVRAGDGGVDFVGSGGTGPGRKKATGGYIAGPGSGTSDSIPAYLSNGEYVMRASAVQKYGINMFDGLNAEKYAKGGSVGKRTRARRSLNNLDVDLSVDETGASDALAQFADDVDTVRGFFKDAGIKWTKALDAQTDAVRQSARQYDAINATLSAARGNKASFASSVGSSLGRDVFGNGLAGFDAGVAANTNDFNTANSGLAAAIRNGLDGALLEALASSGDINALTQFGQLDAAGIAERERQFAAMQSAQSNFGNTAAGARYDGEIAKALADSARETKELRAELKKIGDRVERGARNGTHSGASQAGRDADTRTTQGTQTSGRGGGRRGGNR